MRTATLVILSVTLVVVASMPRYVLVPVEDLQYMVPHVRVPRQAGLPPSEHDHQEDSDDRHIRQSEGYAGPHVDYGAYTGGYGAFGWYSDHPVGNRR